MNGITPDSSRLRDELIGNGRKEVRQTGSFGEVTDHDWRQIWKNDGSIELL